MGDFCRGLFFFEEEGGRGCGGRGRGGSGRSKRASRDCFAERRD